MKLDKRNHHSPAEAFLSLIPEEDIYDDTDMEPSELHIFKAKNKKMNRRNGFVIDGQKFGTNKRAFSILGPENPESVVIDAYFDTLDCRSVTCVGLIPGTNEQHTFKARNVMYKNSEIPVSFDVAVPYQTAFQQKLKYHEPTTQGKKVPKPGSRDTTDRTDSINLKETSFNPDAVLENAGKTNNTSKSTTELKKIQKQQDEPTKANEPVLLNFDNDYGEIPQDD